MIFKKNAKINSQAIDPKKDSLHISDTPQLGNVETAIKIYNRGEYIQNKIQT